MRAMLVFGAGAAVSVVTWLLAAELHPAARVLTAFLIGVFPAFSMVQARAIERLEHLPSRNQLYASTIIALWALAIATALIASQAGMDARLLRVVKLGWGPFALWTGFALLAMSALLMVFMALGMAETRMIRHLIPQTRLEKAIYVGVSLTAGICEELVFRGFLLATLTVATGSVAVSALVSAVAFGVAHAHQAWAGALRAGLLALVLTVPVLFTDSLYPAIAAHAIIDLVAGLSLARWLLRS